MQGISQATTGIGNEMEDAIEVDLDDHQEPEIQVEVEKGDAQKHEPKEGSPRWNKIYGEKKELERKVARMEAEIAEFRKERHEEKNEKFLSTKEAFIAALDQAAEEQDTAKYHQVNKQYMAFLESNAQATKPPATSDPTGDELMSTIQEKYPWFQNDKKRTDAFFDIQSRMIEEAKRNPGRYKTNLEFVLDVANRVEDRFLATKNELRNFSASDGITNYNAIPQNIVRLTSEQKAVALKLFADFPEKEALKMYAKALKNVKG